jgi:hypothetical protein
VSLRLRPAVTQKSQFRSINAQLASCVRYAVNVQTGDVRIDFDPEDFEYFLRKISLSFGVVLTGEEIRKATTVGDLFDQVSLKMGTFDSPQCLTSFAFYRLRRSLVEVSGLDRRSIHPKMPLQNLLPPQVWRSWWHVLGNGLRLRMPSLLSRTAMEAYCVVVLFGVLMFAVGRSHKVPRDAGLVIQFAVPLVVYWLFRAISHSPPEFPTETFGDLVRAVVTLNQQKLAVEAGGSTSGQAWTAFRELLSEASGLPVTSINREMPLLIA